MEKIFNLFFFFEFLFINIIYINCDESIECFEYTCEKCTSNNYGSCTECKSGFQLIDGTCPCFDYRCALCPSSSLIFSFSFYQKCELCKNEYIINNNKCYSTIEYCDVQKENKCLFCYDGYVYNEDLNVCEEETEENKRNCRDANCAICLSDEEEGVCEECNPNYILRNGKCCESSSESDNECVRNKNPISTSCLTGCEVCYSDKECIYCRQGYYLKNGACEQCINGCSHCADNTKCQYCFSQYKMTVERKCELKSDLPDSLDFDVNLYIEKKNQLIQKEKSTLLKCSDENCRYCHKLDGQEICTECLGNYKLEGISCKKQTNYMAIIYAIIIFVILALFIIFFCWYKQKKIQERHEIIRNRITQGNIDNMTIYNRQEIESSGRKELTKEEILEDFEKQKIKTEKGFEACQFCKTKPGKYKCDCNCVVCKEHSLLKKQEGDGEEYKVCFNCGKIVKKVSPIKKECNICFGKKITLVHFQCNCAIMVCKDCYLKCKMESDKCPGCRAKI